MLALGYSIRQHHPHVPFVVMFFPDAVSRSNVTALAALGYQMMPIERIAPPANRAPSFYRFRDQYSKLQVWQMSEYDRIVYIDADCLVLGDISALMELPRSMPFAAVPDVADHGPGTSPWANSFNAGVMSLVPCQATYDFLHDVLMSNECGTL